jgi:hypothetical protein
MTAWRQLLRRSLTRAKADGLSCHNVLIAGTNPLAQSLAQHLTHHPHFGLLLIGHLETMEDPSANPQTAGVAHTSSLANPQNGGWAHSGRASTLSQPSDPEGVSPAHTSSLAYPPPPPPPPPRPRPPTPGPPKPNCFFCCKL